MTTTTRIQSLDLIKIIAMIGVISLHTTLAFLSYDNIICRGFYSMGGWAIPLFFTVSGFLLIGKEMDKPYLLKKITRILRLVLFVSIIYWFKDGDYSIKVLFVDTFLGSFIQHGSCGHFWFFGTLIILYLFLPVFNRLIMNEGATLLCLIMLFVVLSITFISNIISSFETNIIQTFRLWNWFFFFILGGYIKRYYWYNRSFSHIHVNPHKIILGGVIMIIIYTVFFTYLSPLVGFYGVEYPFGSTLCIISVITLFVSILSLNIKSSFIIKELSVLFVPVYAFHDRVIGAVMKYGHLDFFGYWEPICQWGIVVVLIILAAWIIMKTPFLNRIFTI